jgi:hypothetical protein
MAGDLLLQVVNEITTQEEFEGACLLLRHSIERGDHQVSALHLMGLAVQGHILLQRLTPNGVSSGFLSVLGAEPPMGDNGV